MIHDWAFKHSQARGNRLQWFLRYKIFCGFSAYTGNKSFLGSLRELLIVHNSHRTKGEGLVLGTAQASYFRSLFAPMARLEQGHKQHFPIKSLESGLKGTSTKKRRIMFTPRWCRYKRSRDLAVTSSAYRRAHRSGFRLIISHIRRQLESPIHYDTRPTVS